MAIKDNMRPHRPTLVTTLVIVVILFGIYHLASSRKRKAK